MPGNKKVLDLLRVRVIMCVSRNKEVRPIAENSRAEYMKARRKEQKTFSVALDKEKAQKFEAHLEQQKKTKSSWLNEKIDEELESN